MVDDYNCPIKEKYYRWNTYRSIQQVEIDTLGFPQWAEIMISIGYMPTLYLDAEKNFWMNLDSL